MAAKRKQQGTLAKVGETVSSAARNAVTAAEEMLGLAGKKTPAKKRSGAGTAKRSSTSRPGAGRAKRPTTRTTKRPTTRRGKTRAR